MRTFTIAVMALFAFAAVAPRAALAQVSVGDEINPSFTTIDGKALDAKALKGKILVLDFWATWCGPCMQAVPHMVKLNEEYGNKGVVIIGISADRSLEPLKRAIVQHKMDWVHVHDEGGRIAGQFGVRGYPTIFIVSPDFKVLWEGHPNNLDAALAGAFKNHPPILVDAKMLKGAKETLAQVTQKLEAGDAKAAMKLMAKVPADAAKDADFAAAAGEARERLEEVAAGLLAAAEAAAAAGNFVEAADRLRELSLSLAGLPAAADAKKKYTQLMAQPDARRVIETAQKESQAAPLLAEAEKLRAAKKNEAAYPRFKQIAKTYAGTPSGDKAAEVVRAYESDKAFMQALKNKASGGKAAAALSMARSYAKAGRKAEATKKYQSIIKEYPDTTQARTAEFELRNLD